MSRIFLRGNWIIDTVNILEINHFQPKLISEKILLCLFFVVVLFAREIILLRRVHYFKLFPALSYTNIILFLHKLTCVVTPHF